MRRFLCLISAGLLCGGCASVPPRQYAKEEPVLDLRRYVKLVGTWSNDVGRLEEDFTYSDGATQRRVWTIARLDANHYTGTADDVIGTAQGEAFGNALNWRYTLALPVGKKVYNVKFDDWMFLMDDEVMLNRAVMSKWGLRLGEVTLAFRKLRPGAPFSSSP
jgi:hypothetical protein